MYIHLYLRLSPLVSWCDILFDYPVLLSTCTHVYPNGVWLCNAILSYPYWYPNSITLLYPFISFLYPSMSWFVILLNIRRRRCCAAASAATTPTGPEPAPLPPRPPPPAPRLPGTGLVYPFISFCLSFNILIYYPFEYPKCLSINILYNPSFLNFLVTRAHWSGPRHHKFGASHSQSPTSLPTSLSSPIMRATHQTLQDDHKTYKMLFIHSSSGWRTFR